MKNHIHVLRQLQDAVISEDLFRYLQQDRNALEALKAFTGLTEYSLILDLYNGLKIGDLLKRVLAENWNLIKEILDDRFINVWTPTDVIYMAEAKGKEITEEKAIEIISNLKKFSINFNINPEKFIESEL